MSILLELFFTFFKIGLFTFGGGYAMIPMITQEVTARGWMPLSGVVDFIAVSESTPGPFAVNIATFVGTECAGPIGGICATLGVILPSFIIILIVAKCFMTVQNDPRVRAGLAGLRPAVVGLIAAAVFSVGKTALLHLDAVFTGLEGFFTDFLNWRAVLIFIVMFVITRLKKLHPIMVVLLSGALGCLLFGVLPMFLPIT